MDLGEWVDTSIPPISKTSNLLAQTETLYSLTPVLINSLTQKLSCFSQVKTKP